MEIELEDWEAKIPVRDGSVTVARPPDCDGYELDVCCGDAWVQMRLTEIEVRQLHSALGVLLG